MRKRLISVWIVMFLVYSIFGCAQTVGNTLAPEAGIVEIEDTEVKNEEMADVEYVAAESEETSIFGDEYGQDEAQTEPITYEPDGFVWKGLERGITDTMDYNPYLRKIWIVDRDERIMADDRFDFVITKAENAEIKGYIQLGGGVEEYYFKHQQKNDPKYCSFQGTIYDGKAECTFTYEEQQVELHLTLCENDRIEASIQCDDLEINESFTFRPYNISDEPLQDDISSAEIWLESWGTVYLVTATMDILHPYPFACLTNEKQDILYVFGYGINGSEVWDFFIEDINRDGLQDILAIAWFDESSSYRFVNIMFQKEDGRFQKDNGLQIDGPKDDRASLSGKYYGDYRIVQFCPTADFEEYAGEVLNEQEVNSMLGSTVEIKENLLVTYDSERRRGTNKNRKMPSGDNMVVEFRDEYAYCSWRPVTTEVIEDEYTFNYNLRKAVGYKNYMKIDGVIYNEAMGIQEFFTMKDEDKLIMHSLLTGQYFILEKIDRESEIQAFFESADAARKINADIKDGNYIDTEQVIADFLSMDSIKFSEKYDRDDLYYSGILYCGLDAWKYNGSMLSAFQEKYYDVENVTAIRFYKKQPVPVYLNMNINDQYGQREEKISIAYHTDYAVSVYSKPADDGLSCIQEISFVKIELSAGEAPEDLYDFIESDYYEVMEELNGAVWVLSPDGEKAACVSNGMIPGHPSQIFIRYKEDKPYTVYREYGDQGIAGWIDDDHLVCYHHDSYPVLMHLERNETEEIPREKCDYDAYGVKYYIRGNNVIAQPAFEKPYRWEILEKDGEIYVVEPD